MSELFRRRALVVTDNGVGGLDVEATFDRHAIITRLDEFEARDLARALAEWQAARPVPIGPREHR